MTTTYKSSAKPAKPSEPPGLLQFDHMAAWHHIALPLWENTRDICPQVIYMAQEVHEGNLQQDRTTLNIPIPPTILERTRELPTLTLAQASLASHMFGHWVPSLREVDLEAYPQLYGPWANTSGWGWKLANILDQIIAHRLQEKTGIKLPDGGRGRWEEHGIWFRVQDGRLVAVYNTATETASRELGLADEVMVQEAKKLEGDEPNLVRLVAWAKTYWGGPGYEGYRRAFREWAGEVLDKQLAQGAGEAGEAGEANLATKLVDLARKQAVARAVIPVEDPTVSCWPHDPAVYMSDKFHVYLAQVDPNGVESLPFGYTLSLSHDVALTTRAIEAWAARMARKGSPWKDKIPDGSIWTLYWSDTMGKTVKVPESLEDPISEESQPKVLWSRLVDMGRGGELRLGTEFCAALRNYRVAHRKLTEMERDVDQMRDVKSHMQRRFTEALMEEPQLPGDWETKT